MVAALVATNGNTNGRTALARNDWQRTEEWGIRRSRRALLGQAVAASVVGVASSVEWHGAAVGAPSARLTGFQRGFSVSVVGNDPHFRTKLTVLLDRLLDLNVNSVRLALSLFQENWTSSTVFTKTDGEFGSITDDNLKTFVEEAHKRRLSVMVSPLLDEQSLIPDGQWRGSIQPADTGEWFRSYTSLIDRYGRLAQELGVEALVVGSELQSLEAAADDWVELIRTVREGFGGDIVYAFNWDSLLSTDGLDRPSLQVLTNALDYIGISSYYPLDAPSGAVVDEIVAAWQPWMANLDSIRNAYRKPILFTEVGARSIKDSYQTSNSYYFDHGIPVPVDERAQEVYFQSVCAGPKRLLQGLYVWRVNVYTLELKGTPEEMVSYSPLNKLAEGAIKDCFHDVSQPPVDLGGTAEPTAAVPAGATVVISGDRVNLRSGPSLDSKVVAVLIAGTELTTIGPSQDGWVPVEDAKTGLTGFVAREYLQIA